MIGNYVTDVHIRLFVIEIKFLKNPKRKCIFYWILVIINLRAGQTSSAAEILRQNPRTRRTTTAGRYRFLDAPLAGPAGPGGLRKSFPAPKRATGWASAVAMGRRSGTINRRDLAPYEKPTGLSKPAPQSSHVLNPVNNRVPRRCYGSALLARHRDLPYVIIITVPPSVFRSLSISKVRRTSRLIITVIIIIITLPDCDWFLLLFIS